MKRVIIKIPGNAFKYKRGIRPFNVHAVNDLAEKIIQAHQSNFEVGVVIGGGNIVHSNEVGNVGKTVGSSMSMMATLINVLYLQNALEDKGMEVRVQTAFSITKVMPYLYISTKTKSYFKKGRIVLFGGKTGNSQLTTDYAAVLRAVELNADMILIGLEGKIKLAADITYKESRKFDLEDIFDKRALDLLIEEKVKIPILFFDIFDEKNMLEILCGKKTGARIVPGF